jgi:hypothetical protein
LPKSIEINVLRVHEVDCPEGEAPIEWVLYTQKPIDTAEQVERIVDIYRARWIIEEYFKSFEAAGIQRGGSRRWQSEDGRRVVGKNGS